ncbi:MAG: cytochrome P450 [Acidimicrobiia bacterium]
MTADHRPMGEPVQIADVDLSDRRTFLDGPPWEYFAFLRREHPVAWFDHVEADGDGFWIVTKWDDVMAVERDPATFSSNLGGTMIEPLAGGVELMMLNQDPPRHTRLKLLVSRMFTPRHIRSIEQNIRVAARDIVDGVIDRGSIDLVTEVSSDLPLIVIAELLGIPADDRGMVRDWSNRMVGAEDPEYGVNAETAGMELYAYAEALARKRMADPQEDVVTALLTGEVDGERLDPLEFNLFFLLLAVAGNETTRNLITGGMLALIEHPDQRARLLADPSLLPSAVEEMLRWVSPVNYFRRTATGDTEIRGVPIATGEKVTLWYPAANRDEDQFPDPEAFDVGRTPNEHVAFGGRGPHHCLGANLARLEIQVLFEELLWRIPDMELAGPVERLRMNLINGIKHMPVTFTPGGAAL